MLNMKSNGTVYRIADGLPAEFFRRNNGEEFRRFLEVLPLAAYTCDAAGMITYFNQRAALAWGREPRLNHPADHFCGSFKMFASDGSPIPHDQCWMALALRQGEGFNEREVVVERPDGGRCTVLAHANPFFDDAGRIVGAVNILVDISDRKRAEETEREGNRRKSEFLAMLAHELRNPLAPIRNAVQVLQIAANDPETVAKAAAVMERQVGQMVRLVDDLLDVSRVDRGTVELLKECTDLSCVIHHAVEAARPHCEEMGHALTVDMPAEPIYLHADPTRMAQIIGNLLNNACKFTNKGGCIALVVERAGDQVIIRVRDNGIGIAPEHLPKIFDMFVQVDKSLERSVNGLGIGLTLVKNLTALHGGSITAHSDGLGRGSEFAVRLPIIEQTRLVDSSEPADPRHPQGVPTRCD
ncbi:MAG: chemotaxis protein methyltransferase CheR [Planctomycetaceae bacterium]|nr:chemotaxis protein methyltransferase CheR [Planctomycetaceae bacterium]